LLEDTKKVKGNRKIMPRTTRTRKSDSNEENSVNTIEVQASVQVQTPEEKEQDMRKRVDKDLTIVQEAIKDSLHIGDIAEQGRDASGDMQYGLSSKGACRVGMRLMQNMIEQADKQQRDFTPKECGEILKHMQILARRLINMGAEV
jgi:hypothetical protein